MALGLPENSPKKAFLFRHFVWGFPSLCAASTTDSYNQQIFLSFFPPWGFSMKGIFLSFFVPFLPTPLSQNKSAHSSFFYFLPSHRPWPFVCPSKTCARSWQYWQKETNRWSNLERNFTGLTLENSINFRWEWGSVL